MAALPARTVSPERFGADGSGERCAEVPAQPGCSAVIHSGEASGEELPPRRSRERRRRWALSAGPGRQTGRAAALAERQETPTMARGGLMPPGWLRAITGGQKAAGRRPSWPHPEALQPTPPFPASAERRRVNCSACPTAG